MSKDLDVGVGILLKQDILLVVERELHELPHPLLVGRGQLVVVVVPSPDEVRAVDVGTLGALAVICWVIVILPVGRTSADATSSAPPKLSASQRSSCTWPPSGMLLLLGSSPTC